MKLEEHVVALYDELRAPVCRYLLCLGIGPADADEVLQEAFLRLFAHLERGGPSQNLRAWIFRVAHNLALNQRRQGRHLSLRAPEEWAALGETRADASLTPELLLLERERMEAIHAAMQTLSPRELHCLHLRMEGLRYREIGEVLGVTISTVAELLRRALVKLRRPSHA